LVGHVRLFVRRFLVFFSVSFLASVVSGDWIHNFPQIQTDSLGPLRQPIVHGSTIHVPFENDGELRGFAANGANAFGSNRVLGTQSDFLPRLPQQRRIGLKGTNDLIVRSSNPVEFTRIRPDGSVAWRLSGYPDLEDFDAFRLVNDEVAIVTVRSLTARTDQTISRISPAGSVLDARKLVAIHDSPSGRFDSQGRLIIQTSPNVLSRLDPTTFESTAAWTRLSDPVRAFAPSRDGGAVILTVRGLIKTASNGSVEWTATLPPLASWNTGIENKIVETTEGSWLVYEGPGNPSSKNLYGVSSSGQLLFSRSAPYGEAESITADGGKFLLDSVYSLSPLTGIATAQSAIDVTGVTAIASIDNELILVGAAYRQGDIQYEPFVRRVNLSGAIVWQRDSFTKPALTMTGSYEQQFCDGARLRRVGLSFVASVVRQQTPNVSNPIIGQTFSAQRVNDSGAFISASTESRRNHCLPAIDSEGTEYWLDQDAGQLRATRSDGSTKWNADVTELVASYSGRLRTALVGTDAVAAEYGRQLRLHDRATGALLWVTYEGVYDQTGRFDGLGVAWSADYHDGLLRISSSGATQSLGYSQYREGTKLLPLRSGGVVAVKSNQVSRFAVDGSLQWTLDISIANSTVNRNGPLLETANGDIVVTGRDDSQSGGRGFFARISPTGALRHRVSISSFSGSNPEPYLNTVSALTERANGELVIGIDNDDAGSSKGAMLRTYDANGVERARFVEPFAGINAFPSFRFADILVDGNGAAVLGYGQDKSKSLPSAFLFKIDSLDAATSELRLLSALPANSRYDSPFAVTVGLRTQAGAVVAASRAVTLRVSREGNLGIVSKGSCVIAIGQSQCTISGVRAHPAPGQPAPATAKLRISADSYSTLVTDAFAVAAAPTTTTIAILSPQPLRALSEFSYQIDFTSASPVEEVDRPGFVSGGCVSVPTTTSVYRLRCSEVARAPSVSISYSFTSTTGAYQSSSSTANISVARTPIIVMPAPNAPNGAKAGALFTMSAYVLLPDGRDVWPNTGDISLRNSASTILCPSMTISSNNGNTPTSAHSCVARETQVGTNPLSVVVDPTDQILGATLSVPFTVIAAYGIEGEVGLISGASAPDFCFAPAGPTCTVVATGASSARFECSTPANWSGKLYLKRAGWRFIGNGGTLGPLSAIEQKAFFAIGSTTACTPDVNQDGSVELDTDGLFILRKLFGLVSEVDYVPLAHACSSATYAEANAFVEDVIARGDWDLDGDGAVLPLTDGLLLLRSMLGIYGEAMTRGAVNPAGARTDANDIAAFLQSKCGNVFRN
jgi:hypothetical protein